MIKIICATTVSALLFTQVAHSAGLRIGFMDSFATGRGNAFAATADNPSAVFYNPAGLAQLETSELSAGAYAIQFSSEHTAPDGTVTDMDDPFKPVPHFYYAQPLKNSPFTFGIGAYLPFGLVTDWPDDSPFRAMATRSEVVYLRINPVVSYQINSQLSIGGGPTFNRSELELRRGIPGPPGSEYLIEADDSAVGFNVGVRWEPTPRHAFGASYHSPTRLRFEGSDEAAIAGYKGDVSIDTLTFPEIVIVGYSFRPTPEWNLEVNVDWTRWSRFDATTIRSEGSGATPLPLNWKSTFFYGVGGTRYFENDYFVSAGYLYADHAVPEDTFNPFLPDTRLHFFSLGVGTTGKTLNWQASYHYGHGPARDIRQPGSPASGRYDNQIHSLALTLALKF